MILVFGGTTEGRKAVEVLEEAGSLYYYSTRGDGQQIELVNGVHLSGGMDVPQMIDCCREHAIRLIVDAAHPFAEDLHRNLLFLARHIGAPIIRYDRIYPPHDGDIIWCKDYADALCRLEAEGVTRLLVLTGVNTIGKLRRFWEKNSDCWFRILNRRASLMMARKAGFPEERLVYYEEDDTTALINDLHPQAIITKESGLSGGFTEKVEAARRAGIKVFVVERPQYPPETPVAQSVSITYVNGPYGLRRAVEKLLPEFFPLKSGLTTGTCATAAAVAFASSQLGASLPSEVPVLLPNGETIMVPVGYGDGYAYCIKQAGDDPDVTNGIEVRVSVEEVDSSFNLQPSARPAGTLARARTFNLEFVGGDGVGHFTLPGFDYPPGEAAINRGPREMIRQNLLPYINNRCSLLRVTISVPGGTEIARRTFNPRLGIDGGISIIGVSGIVKPFSEEAFISSIRKCMQVAVASGTDRVVINSGGKSERFVKALYPELPQQAFVEYGNYIGETLKMADELGVRQLTLGVMLGKAVKLADGQLDTHSRKGTMNKAFIAQMLEEAGCTGVDLSTITLAREIWDLLPSSRVERFAQTIIRHCAEHCRPLLPQGALTILLISDEGEVWGEK